MKHMTDDFEATTEPLRLSFENACEISGDYAATMKRLSDEKIFEKSSNYETTMPGGRMCPLRPAGELPFCRGPVCAWYYTRGECCAILAMARHGGR